VERKGDDAADPEGLAGLFNALSIESDMTGINERLRESPAFHETDEEKEAVNSHEIVIPDLIRNPGTKPSENSR
jgi:hypothetical protein